MAARSWCYFLTPYGVVATDSVMLFHKLKHKESFPHFHLAVSHSHPINIFQLQFSHMGMDRRPKKVRRRKPRIKEHAGNLSMGDDKSLVKLN